MIVLDQSEKLISSCHDAQVIPISRNSYSNSIARQQDAPTLPGDFKRSSASPPPSLPPLLSLVCSPLQTSLVPTSKLFPSILYSYTTPPFSFLLFLVSPSSQIRTFFEPKFVCFLFFFSSFAPPRCYKHLPIYSRLVCLPTFQLLFLLFSFVAGSISLVILLISVKFSVSSRRFSSLVKTIFSSLSRSFSFSHEIEDGLDWARESE